MGGSWAGCRRGECELEWKRVLSRVLWLLILIAFAGPLATAQTLDDSSALLDEAQATDDWPDQDRLIAIGDQALDGAWIPPDERSFESDPLEVLGRLFELVPIEYREHPQWARLSCEYARLLRGAGAAQEALDLLSESHHVFPDDVPFRHWVLIELATQERRMGAWSAALGHLEEAQVRLASGDDSSQSADDFHASIVVFGELGANYIALGLPDLALEPLDEALRMAEQAAEPLTWFEALLNQYNLCLSLDDKQRLEELHRAANAHPLFASLWDVDRAQLSIRLAIGLAEDARQTGASFEEPLRLFEEAMNTKGLEPFEVQQALNGFLWALHDSGQHQRAKEQLEALAKSESAPGESGASSLDVDRFVLAARLAQTPEEKSQAFDALQSAFEPFLELWAGTPLREGGVAYLHYAERFRLLSELVALTAERKGAAQALELVIAAQEQGSLARSFGANHEAVSKGAQDLVGADEALLLLLPGRDQSHAFVVDRAEVSLHVLPPYFQLEESRRRLATDVQRYLLSGEADLEAELRASLEQMGKELLPEQVLQRLEGCQALAVVGTESIGDVPMEALLLEGEPLGVRMAVRYLPSIPIASLLASRSSVGQNGTASPKEDSRDLLLFAATDPGAVEEGDLPAIEFDTHHEHALTSAYDANRTTVHHGSAATLERLVSLPLGDTSILHLVTHGVFDPRRERSAGLRLHRVAQEPAVLWAQQIEAMSAPPLVILTACGAGRASLRRGDDGRSGLVGAFLLAGAQDVLVSKVNLNFDASVRFLGRVHEELVAGSSSTEALLLARRQVWEQAQGREAWQPFFMQLVGQGERPWLASSSDDFSSRWFWGGAALVALALFLLSNSWTRRRAPHSRA